MELRDLLVTPIVIFLVLATAYFIRPMVTDRVNRKYFLPALLVKIVGALAVGLIYQFYYGGGDTFNYHTHGSRHIWEAFLKSPTLGMQLFTADGKSHTDIYAYSSKILFFTDPSSFAIVKMAAFLDLFTFSTYSATAVLFAVISFVGMWMFFLTFYEQYPHLHRWLAIAAFFIPSVFFWGSGLLKDTITLGCLGIATYQAYRVFIKKQFSILNIALLLIALYGIYSIKIYILLTFLPAAIVWVFLGNLDHIRSPILRIMLAPFMITCAVVLGYLAMLKAGEDNAKYSLDNVARTAQITAYDIRYYTGRDAGSGYTLGELDGTFGSMIRLAPSAVNVSLFRPYLWEVKNPLMLLSALESFLLLCTCVYFVLKKRLGLINAFYNFNILFTLIFSITFAFAVGVSTYNFGTLVRYKIPLLPFFVVAMILISRYTKSDKKLDVLDKTE